MIYTLEEGQSFDAEILRQELVAALGADGWYINTGGNTVEFIQTDELLVLDPAPTITTHFNNGAARAAAIAAAEAQKVADEAARIVAKADTVVQYLRDHTPAECEAYVQTNVTDLASARALMKKFAVALCVLSKQSLR